MQQDSSEQQRFLPGVKVKLEDPIRYHPLAQYLETSLLLGLMPQSRSSWNTLPRKVSSYSVQFGVHAETWASLDKNLATLSIFHSGSNSCSAPVLRGERCVQDARLHFGRSEEMGKMGSRTRGSRGEKPREPWRLG